MPDHPDIARLWLVAMVAETFHVLPTVVARDLDSDPEQMSLLCVSLLKYAEAKRAEETAKSEEELASWKGSEVMEKVLRNKYELHKERTAARAARAAEEERQKT